MCFCFFPIVFSSYFLDLFFCCRIMLLCGFAPGSAGAVSHSQSLQNLSWIQDPIPRIMELLLLRALEDFRVSWAAGDNPSWSLNTLRFISLAVLFPPGQLIPLQGKNLRRSKVLGLWGPQTIAEAARRCRPLTPPPQWCVSIGGTGCPQEASRFQLCVDAQKHLLFKS